MKLKPYPKYKASGVEWLGDVPDGWRIQPLKLMFKIVGGSTPKSEQAEYWNGEIIWVTPSDLSKLSSIGINDSQRKITASGLASCGATLVPSGSIVLSTRAPIGSLAIAEAELCTNQGCKSLVPLANTRSLFYGYLLSVSTVELNIRGKGTTFLELSGDELGAFKVGAPSADEQSAIATFLDRETAKIDTLIAKQEKLIDLLKEKRQAVISHAVTKGLDPTVPMKLSGVEWLGDVPEHWIPQAKLVSMSGAHQWSFVNGPFGSDLLTEELTAQGVPVIYIRDVKANGYKRVSTQCVTPEKAGSLKFCGTISGDILVAKVGDPPGAACVYPEGNEYAIVTQDVIRMRPDPFIAISSYLCYLLNSATGRIAIDLISVASTRIRIGLGDFKQMRLPLPPIAEQRKIANYLDDTTAKIDTLIAKAQQAIALQKEHRTALISAAVTGEIDVRMAVPQREAA